MQAIRHRFNLAIIRKRHAQFLEHLPDCDLLLRRQRDAFAAEVRAAKLLNTQLARLDWLKFAEKFRGAEEYVKERQRIYAGRFRGLFLDTPAPFRSSNPLCSTLKD